MLLESYLQDTWATPTAAEATVVDVHDAVTGETVCRVSSQGLDLAAAFHHARTHGGPPLRGLTFHQRADLLDALAAAVRARREELYALSARAGATPNDARYDVDGGIRVLRDNLTAKPYVKFYTTKRVGGGVVNYEAYKLMKFH